MTVSLLIAAVLAAFVAYQSHAGGYTIATTLTIVAAMVAQAAVAFAAGVGVPAMLLGLALAAAAISAKAVLERQDVRSIVTAGGALAGAQFLTPLGGLIAATVAPSLLMLWWPRMTPRQSLGFAVLLLFPQIIVAILLFCLTPKFHGLAGTASNGNTALAAYGAVLVAAPLAAVALSHGRGRPAALAASVISFAVVAALGIGGLFGVTGDARVVVAALAPVIALGTCAWDVRTHRSNDALWVSGLSVAFAWFIAAMVSP